MTQQGSGRRQNESSTGTGAGRLRDMADATGEKVKGTAKRTEEFADKVADQARAYGERTQEMATQIRPLVEKSLKERPMATLAGAAVLGFLLGAIWKK